jgi:hypothetical protein
MDILKYRTVTGSAGFSTVAAGVNLSQIISVKRQGIQHDYVGLLNIHSSNRAWSYLAFNRRIIFNSSFPFAEGGEIIYIMYKVSV